MFFLLILNSIELNIFLNIYLFYFLKLRVFLILKSNYFRVSSGDIESIKLVRENDSFDGGFMELKGLLKSGKFIFKNTDFSILKSSN
jgi:hypothetical protein